MTIANRLATANVNAYRQLSVETEASSASPHRLIGMMLRGARDKIQTAKGNLDNGDVAAKCSNISLAISIVAGLKGSLNLDAGGDIARNLDDLYEYMIRALTRANLDNDRAQLEAVDGLLREIQEAWQAIA